MQQVQSELQRDCQATRMSELFQLRVRCEQHFSAEEAFGSYTAKMYSPINDFLRYGGIDTKKFDFGLQARKIEGRLLLEVALGLHQAILPGWNTYAPECFIAHLRLFPGLDLLALGFCQAL